MRLSAYLLGVFSPSLPPTKAQASSTLYPTMPRYSSPRRSDWGAGSPGQGLAVAFRGRARFKWGAASLSNKWVKSRVRAQHWLLSMCLMIVLFADPGLPHRSLTGTRWMVPTCVLLLCDQVDVLFYSGEESWSCEWRARPLTAEKRKAVDWPGNEKERERLFRARFLSLIVCPLRFEYAHSKQTRKMLQPLALLAFSLFFSICN